tara:strand:+ start:19000 stop:19392 length:393 start_codon:yes stop_codon:yes gene_type:complete
MFQRKRRFRSRSNGRNHQRHANGDNQSRMRPDSFSGGQRKNNFRQNHSAEKLFDKYSILAKEAMSSGDKTLSENYFQHADHYRRVIDEKMLNQKKIMPQGSSENQNTSQSSSDDLKKKEIKPESNDTKVD